MSAKCSEMLFLKNTRKHHIYFIIYEKNTIINIKKLRTYVLIFVDFLHCIKKEKVLEYRKRTDVLTKEGGLL